MTVLVACETLLLVLLTVLVAGLLRSHAELLRRIGPGQESSPSQPSALPATGGGAAADVAGVTPRGDAVQLSLAGEAPPTLLAFLSSGCAGCRAFWQALAAEDATDALPEGVRLAIVTHDGAHESPARIAQLAPAHVPVVMSQAAWRDYSVPVTPYAVFVDPRRGRVIGEGTAESWPQVAALVADALADGVARWDGPGVDATLAASGITAGHPSLYPSGNGSAADRERRQ